MSMNTSITPIIRQNLSDNLAQKIKQFIIAQNYSSGDRLPTTADLAQRFGVGHPTLREAIKKLETIGVVTVKHGSGIYVGEHIDSLVLPNPIAFEEAPTKRILLDLIETRIILEVQSIAKAAENVTKPYLHTMAQLLKEAEANLDNDLELNRANMGFHREIAAASGNSVLHQILGVITSYFKKEQLLIMDIYRSKERDHEQHVKIYEALRLKDKKLAVHRMKSHLEEVRESILKWNPDDTQ